MKKPLIALIPLVDSERESYWMLPGYMKGIEKAGGIPVMLPLTSDREILERVVSEFDGFLLTGGHDIDPHFYGEENILCGEISKERDDMERYLIENILKLDKPVLGICRGLQILNAVLGGTLYQDLPKQYPSDVSHHQSPPYDRPVHALSVRQSTPLHRLLGTEMLQVNSYHHQGIRSLAPGLEAMAFAPDGLIESVRLPDAGFVWAVQWHPEFSYLKDRYSLAIFEEFIRNSSGFAGISL